MIRASVCRVLLLAATLSPTLRSETPGVPNLTVSLTHTSAFLRGQTNAVYLIRVTNVGTAATSGPISVTDALPSGLTLTSMTGPGWTCLGSTCTRADIVQAGQMLPTITVLATIGANAPNSVSNTVTVAGGGDQNAADNSATDLTSIASEGWLLAMDDGTDYTSGLWVPHDVSDAVSVAASKYGGIVLHKDGTVSAWTFNYPGNLIVPSNLTGIVAVGVTYWNFFALKSDGTVTGWSPWAEVPDTTSLTDIVALSADPWMTYPVIALHADGTVTALGYGTSPELTVPSGLTGVVQVNTNSGCVAAVTAQGSVVTWGSGVPPTPAGLGRLTQAACLGDYSVAAIRPDGTVVAWDKYGTSAVAKVPAGLDHAVALTGAYTFAAAVRDDGTVQAWGRIPGGLGFNYFPNAPQALSTLTHTRLLVATMDYAVAILSAKPILLHATTSAPPLADTNGHLVHGAFFIDGYRPHFGPFISLRVSPGSTHTLSTEATQVPDGGTVRFDFDSWSDNGPATHQITLGDADASYSLVWKPYFLLETITSVGGTVTPETAFWPAGAQVQVTATPAAGYTFTGFSAPLSGTANPQTILLSGPSSVTASFIGSGLAPPVIDSPGYLGSDATAYLNPHFTPGTPDQQLAWVQILFAAAPDGGGRPFCFLHYDVQGNGLWFYGDQGFFVGPHAPGAVTGNLRNGLCAVSTESTVASFYLSTLTVATNITFKSTAALKVYFRAYTTAGVDTGWIQRGTWSAKLPALPAMAVSPNGQSSVSPFFSALYPDPPGFEGVNQGWAQFLIAAAPDGGGQPFCFLHYDKAGNGLWMYSSDVGFFLGPVAPGTASTDLDSSACSLNTAYTSISKASGLFYIHWPVTLKPPMSGLKNIYQRTLDPTGRDTGWVQTGTWTIP
ncbi:InlB B-repeat-containing protein [Paludibaculum fermentans]|uniref:DUF11 domain-containing protein n=1 Tax=Paludibaculum fermentans TaxID=1473598 RepID=A0A7S7SMV4_PALFE|nr:DUF11 domain-containing protein [Paludibaculum fermentans]QOY89886.1 hypothetical protein IRI77_08005 [Paludibaculum fermentans]